MKRHVFGIALIAMFAFTSADVRAQTEETGTQNAAGQPELMTQAQLIEVLVNSLGLATMLPPNPSQSDMIQILMQNGIVPREGWQPDQVVTLGSLARVIVQALGQWDVVDSAQDDGALVDHLLSLGLDLSTIEAAIRQVPTADPNAGYSDARQSFDPSRRYPFSVPFAGAGFSVQAFREIFTQVIPPVPPAPRPVTPN